MLYQFYLIIFISASSQKPRMFWTTFIPNTDNDAIVATPMLRFIGNICLMLKWMMKDDLRQKNEA
jgi:hypothetical protein